MVALFTHHLGFWFGVFAGGAGGYLWGATVKASVERELASLRAWADAVKAGKLKV